MTEKTDHRTKLLAETFHEDWTEGKVALFAQQAAAHARQRRRMSRVLLPAAGTAAIVAAFLAIGPAHRTAPNDLTTAATQPSPLYEIISDEELLTQLHDRPLLIVQHENGTKELILLDR